MQDSPARPNRLALGPLEPDRKIARRRQVDALYFEDRFVREDLGDRLLARTAVEIQNPDCRSAGCRAADRHLGDIHVMATADGADDSNDAGNILVVENKKVAIQKGFKLVFAELD